MALAEVLDHGLAELRGSSPAIAKAREPAPAPARRFLPGASWLYVKLYTGTATADALLRDDLAPVIDRALATGIASSWFFLRYGDPDWHLRVRFAGDPQRLGAELLPLLHEALAPASERGRLWRLVVDTYEREVERYGGAAGIAIAEELFRADSDAALAILASCEGDAGAERRGDARCSASIACSTTSASRSNKSWPR